MSLHPDILLHYLCTSPIELSAIPALRRLSSFFYRLIPSLIKRLELPFAAPLSRLLALFEGKLPLLSGALYVDLPYEDVAWEQVSYQHLTLHFEEDFSNESLVPLYTQAINDRSKSLTMYRDQTIPSDQIIEGYVTRNLTRFVSSEHLIVNHERVRAMKTTKHVWIKGSWSDESQPKLELRLCKSVETIRADCPFYVTHDEVMSITTLKELGPMVIVVLACTEDMGDVFTHPHLRHLNVVADKHTIEWALKQDITFTLYAPKAMLNLLKRRHADQSKIVGYQALD